MKTTSNLPRALAWVAFVLLEVSGCGSRQEPSSSAPTAPLPATVDSMAAARGTSGGAGSDTLRGDRMPVVAVGGRAADSVAATPLTLTLGAIGYRDGIVLTGTTASTTLAIPVDDGLHPAQLHLQLMTTPFMPAATLVLSQRDHVIAMRGITDTTTSLTLPLAGVVVDNGKATMEIGLSVPGRDLCQAALFYRTVLAPESQVSFTGTPAPGTEVNTFFQPWLEHVTYYLADLPSLDAAQAALDASAYVGRRYRGMATTFDIAPLPPAGMPLPEPAPWSRALVWTPNGTTAVASVPNGRGTVLTIGARRDARQLFTLAEGADMVAAPGFRTATVDLGHNTADMTASVTLADLGFANHTIEGNAQVDATYSIALADFGTAQLPSSFRLIVHHSVLPPHGSGSLRLHLNGNLIYSRALEGDGFDEVIAIPAHLVQRDNVFDVRFQVTLGEGQCLIGGPVFTATVDNGSTFLMHGGTDLAPGFDRFPQAFVPAFSVLLEPRDRFRVQLAAAVINAMQQTTAMPLAPALARDEASATGPLLAVGTTSLAQTLDAPVQTAGFRLRDRDGKVWDDFAPTAPYGAMQGWVRDGNDVLLLDHTGTDGQPLADLVHEALAPYGWFGVRGDLAVRGMHGPTRVLTAANAGWRIEAEPPPPENLFVRYRTIIFIVAALLIAALLLWFYPRVVRRDLDTTG